MINEAFFIYFIFEMILFIINLIGYFKIPAILIFGTIGTLLIAVPTILSFGDYYLFGVILILINISIPIYGLSHLE